jgi:lysine 2,3-aminomutase
MLMPRPTPSTLAALPAKPLRAADELVAAGLIGADQHDAAATISQRYAIAVTPAMAALMRPGDRHDPIARQFLPDPRELITMAEELADPIGDAAHSPVPGIVHRYADRALIKMLHACPVYCRFCFRREMVGPGGAALTGEAFARAIAYLARTPAIREVIVTGGDPFMLSARRVSELMAALAPVPHIRIVRWHTRVPVVDPARVTDAFVEAMTTGGKATYVAIHANHPRELTAEAQAAIARLRRAGVTLLSQSVLLNGVNADADTLEVLMRAFAEAGVKPYYLHHPDLAPGTGHFRLAIAEGRTLMAELRGRLSGIALPAYVLDIPGGHGKVPLDGDHVIGTPDGRTLIRDRGGRLHAYPPEQPSAQPAP